MITVLSGTGGGSAPSAQGTGSARLLVLNKEDANAGDCRSRDRQRAGHASPVGQGPHELVTSTDGKLAFASNYGTGPAPGHTISMIDIAAQKELRRIDVSPLSRPHGLAFLNGKLYFTAEADKKVARYDPARDQDRVAVRDRPGVDAYGAGDEDAMNVYTSNIGSRQRVGDRAGRERRLDADGDSRRQGTGRHRPVAERPRDLERALARRRRVGHRHQRRRRSSRRSAIGTKRSNRIKLTPDGKFALVSDHRRRRAGRARRARRAR